MKGTTPTHTFVLPFDVSVLKVIKVTYKQGDKIIVTKKTADCICEGSTVVVNLTQEETLKFDENKLCKFQLRALTQNDKAIKTPVMTKEVSALLDDEVLI